MALSGIATGPIDIPAISATTRIAVEAMTARPRRCPVPECPVPGWPAPGWPAAAAVVVAPRDLVAPSAWPWLA